MKDPQPNHTGVPASRRSSLLTLGSILAGFCLLANSLVAQTLMEFNFNEGTGTNVTSTDGKLVGTFVGSPVFSSDTPSGLEGDFSLQFAAGQRVNVPDPNKVLALDTANASFTVQAWLKFATPSTRSVYFYNNGPGGAVSASVNPDRTAFVTTLGKLDQASSAPIPDDGKWHHVAVVHEDKKEFRFYVDGALADTRAYTSSVLFTRTNQIFYIGAESTGGLQFVGSLDRLRYSKGILTAAQLDAKAIPANAKPAGSKYATPSGGWTYIFDGHKDTPGDDGSGYTSLDGTWSHDNGSDQSDGSKLGGTLITDSTFGSGNAPGGVMTITENSVTFLRMQDPGDPRNYGFPDPYSNRKIYYGHDITTSEAAPDTLLDDGMTLSFRARIPTPSNTKAPLDALYLSGGSTPTPYPTAGDGYLISDGGKGNVGVKQLSGGIISFALTVPRDNFDDSAGGPTANFSGLTMNQLNGTAVIADVNFNSPGEFRGVPFDSTAWHEFWITIKADASGVGTHQVTIYMDGSAQPATNVVVTAGNGNDFPGTGYLTIGGSRTAESWALDLDFVAYKAGADAPVSSEPLKITSIVRQIDNVVITWTGGGVLQAASNITGPWSDIAGSASPATIKITDPRKFYRAKK